MIRIESYDAAWADRFADLGRGLRDALGDVALRIDHIGSTAVPDLAAKPIVDIQLPRAGRCAPDPHPRPQARQLLPAVPAAAPRRQTPLVLANHPPGRRLVPINRLGTRPIRRLTHLKVGWAPVGGDR
ncbi:GrpB family protein [Kribbella rubisoli]|uniref:GrpB family protein n=1 Tax=Kribbella rubisoli TaxID=3075929 RepID=UPI001F540F96|nr:GrpB family protein [Kribbella rubisoli]